MLLFLCPCGSFNAWRGVLDNTLCDKVCQRLATGRLFSPGTAIYLRTLGTYLSAVAHSLFLLYIFGNYDWQFFRTYTHLLNYMVACVPTINMLTCDISNASVFLTNILYINRDKKYDSKLWKNEEHTRISNCFNTNDHGYVSHVVNTCQSFPRSGLITGVAGNLFRPARWAGRNT